MRNCLYTFMIVYFMGIVGGMPAMAEEPDPALLKDYFGLVKLLQADGIEPTRVGWSAITPACLGLKEDDQTAYNRCLYEKAVDEAAFREDTFDCDEVARADFPDALMKGTVVIQKNTLDTGATENASITQPALSATDLRAKRRAGFLRCMSNRGWRDTDNFLRGKETSSHD